MDTRFMNLPVHISSAMCVKCGANLQWVKETFYVEGKHYDWRLRIWCPTCNAEPTIAAREAIRCEHELEVAVTLSTLQEDAIRGALGDAAWERLEEHQKFYGLTST